MKKILNVILVLTIVLCTRTFAMAENVGVIDITQVWEKYEKSIQIDKAADAKDVELEKFILEKKRLIAEGTTPVERKNLEDRYSKEFQCKVEETKKWYVLEQQKLETNIMTAVKDVSAQKNISAVFNKKMVIMGGTDITNDVITILNK